LFITLDHDGIINSEAAYENELPTGFGMTGVSGGPFQAGETLSIDGGTYTATVVSHVVSRGVLFIEGFSPIPSSYNSAMRGLSLSGGTSGATATITTNFRDIFGHWLLKASEEIYIEGAASQPNSGDTLTFGGGHTALVDTVDAATGRIALNTCTGVVENGESVSWSGGSGTVAVAPLNWGRWTIESNNFTMGIEVIDNEPIYYGEDPDRLLFLIPNESPVERYNVFALGLWVTSTIENSRYETASWSTPQEWVGGSNSFSDSLVWGDAYGSLCAMGTESGAAGVLSNAFRPVPATSSPSIPTANQVTVATWLSSNLNDRNKAELISPFFVRDSINFPVIFSRLDDVFLGSDAAVRSVVQPNSWSGSRPFLFSLDTNRGAYLAVDQNFTP